MTLKNVELQLAHEFVQDTDCNIFLTGKAGTGKTTFLHSFKGKCSKRMIVTAPTGVAAINAGGVTLHSFFQMPFGPFVPGHEGGERNRHKFNKQKIKIIRSLDLLVIDEISMVRADLLDGVDAVLRRYRHSSEPFGGVQLLMIGDLHQLPPVVKDADWDILREYYDSVYFFSSNALKQTELISVELKHIYRQSDPGFINLLNRVRNNDLDDFSIKELNRRYIPDFTGKDSASYITLCTHNHRANKLNRARLSKLSKKMYRFDAKVEGEFPEYSYPAPALLELKEGAQVMFVRNDQSQDKLYYNGKIGIISHISADTIRVRCPGDSDDISVEQTDWENMQYMVDAKSKEITEKKIGVFRQYPLKLAWAITIHKSQGLTFEKAVIDAQAAFAHGQVYVALSRCKTLEGMVLSTPLSSEAVKTDAVVAAFTRNGENNPPSRQQLEAAQIRYQQRLVLACFDFQTLRSYLDRFSRLLLQYSQVIHLPDKCDVQETASKTMADIVVVGENFQHQLGELFSGNKLPESDPHILERITKGSAYFQEKITSTLMDFFADFKVETDNKEIRKNVREALKQLRKETAVKLAAVQSCEAGFSSARYLRAISTAEIDFKPARERKADTVQYTEADVGHPELFQQLREWRSKKAADEEVAHFRILHQKVLIQIAVNLPDNPQDLMKVKGIGKRLAEKYGRELVELVSEYRKKHGVSSVDLPEPVEKAPGLEKEKYPDLGTKEISFEMFQSGMTIEDIIKQRGLVRSTIEGHLGFFVEQGDLAITKLISSEKQQAIERKLVEMKDTPYSEIKKSLGDAYSYGEMKLVIAHLNSQNKG
jgi:hypothetical protein